VGGDDVHIIYILNSNAQFGRAQRQSVTTTLCRA
jgi:hypothetical protein